MSSTFDAVVAGAGVFGAWTALKLQRAGLRVALLDAHGAGNSRASSGDESRIIRMGYGSDQIYTRSAMSSFEEWQALITEIARPLFCRTGVLWLARRDSQYVIDTNNTLMRAGVPVEELSRSDVERRYPQIDLSDIDRGILEPDSGVLMARQLVHEVVQSAMRSGVTYWREGVLSPLANNKSHLNTIQTSAGREINAGEFVFACGPWLPKLFPELLSDLIQPTRQEVFYFGVPPGDIRFAPPALPVWIDFEDLVYVIPDVEGRGLKMAIDAHGAAVDPETMDRTVTAEGTDAIRKHLARRFPLLADAPIIETRVCQYENTSNGDFLIDRHPGFENVWLVGGGSGHGFKHGPSVGGYVTALVTSDNQQIEPRFTLATKSAVQQRKVY